MQATKVLFRGRKAYDGWFKERFGDHIVQMSTDSTLKLRAAVRDAARMLHRRCLKCGRFYEGVDFCASCQTGTTGFIPEDIENWCRKFEEAPMGVTEHNFVIGYSSEEEGWIKGSIEYDPPLMEYAAAYPEDFEIVKEALGLARQKGRHPCGFVLANWRIASRIPLTTVGGHKVTSFTAKSVEGVGGIKMDFLNIKILEKIQGALKLIQQRSADPSAFVDMHINGRLVPAHRLVPVPGGFADVWDLPADQAVFQDVAEGRTETVFQFDTPGVRQWMEYFDYVKPDGTMGIDSVESMSAFTALDRPGGLDVFVRNPEWAGADGDPAGTHNMLVEYSRRARGAPGSQDVLPMLEELVPETHGVMVYQEQWQRVYQTATGCTGVEAEEMRRNVSKKEKEIIDKAYPLFIERAGARYGEESAQKLWGFLKAWAKYGFNKSHAVCYAMTGYVCAYLKHHFSLEWWCSVLQHTKKEKIAKDLWRHCRHMVLLPDVQSSKEVWAIEGTKIRAPMGLLQGIGQKAHEQLCKFAPYDSIIDFAQKIKAHQEATKGPKQKKVKGTETYETVIAPGRNAIHRGLVHNLIVSGSMDSLFPKDFSTAECMAEYDAAMLATFGKAYSRTKKTVYPTLDALGRYQARKAVLPIYGDDLRLVVKALGLPHYLKLYDNRRMRYSYKKWDRRTRQEVATEDPVIGGARLEQLVEADDAPLGGWSCAAVAYVEKAERFRYPKATKDKEACKLTLEVEGGRYTMVHWPDREGKLPSHVATVSAGDIVAALLVRWEDGDEFAIRELKTIRTAPDKMTPASAGPEEEKTDEGDEENGG